ncbi:hypothetical protein EV193_103495 [Herbihabitans rhizosphaerae]|uniref:Uncharacterized protein n=1 Tax=Herbihabitans rhizosphaerae TaxID=1872711 RepID=A0A4Q7KWU8_9PSEU|nr:hypothetical protein [Herbihabitans rhizosphaerae]RZS41175.1 hypothetical protein EV193_103495 [Herbihabitans rhizosphaerae]
MGDELDAEAVGRAAESEDAPAELKAVAAAVRAGKTTWEEFLAGEADHLSEVQAFYSARRKHFLDKRSEPGRDPIIFDEW